MKSARLWVPVCIAVVVVTLTVIAIVLATRALAAKGSLEQAIPLAQRVQAQIVAGDSTASATADELADHTAEARAQTDSPLWRAFEWVPVLGSNLEAVRLAAKSTDELVKGAVQPAAALSLDALKPVDGAFDLASLAELADVVDGATATVRAVAEELDTIDRGELLDPVADGIEQLDNTVANGEPILETAQRTLRVLPAALGADGPRRYLMMFQGNSEARSLGGNPAALLVLRVDGGAVSIAQQASSFDFENARSTPVMELDPEAVAIYGDKIGRWIPDITMTPDFTYSAALMRAYWAETFGTPIDGVISFDPVALSYLLTATGPLTLTTGEQLTAENAVSLLLNEVYFRYEEPSMQDAFFAATAGTVFTSLTRGGAEPQALVAALARAVDERRLMYAPSSDAEADAIAGTSIAGRLPTTNEEVTTLGVFVNDNTASKKDYYIDMAIVAHATRCEVNAPPKFTGTVTLTSALDEATAAGLPDYVRGPYFAPDTISTYLVLYGPVGGSLTAVTLDGTPAEILSSGNHLGRPAVKVEVRSGPLSVHEVGFTFTGPEGGEEGGPIEVRHTPMVRNTPVSVSEPRC